MQMRTSLPEYGNKFYNTTSNGGWSRCIQGSPTCAGRNVLANCVGYACSRFNEIIGSMKYPTLNCNAENFIERAKSLGLKVVNYPTLGGIMVWQKGKTLNGGDGAGHLAVVERIDSVNQFYSSESGYGSSAFWNTLRTNNNGRWGQGSAYSFRGCIVNPAIGDVHYIKPKTSTREERVKSLQKALNADYKCGLVIDGSFGPKTESASHNNYLYYLKKRATNHIKWLQSRLIELGYSCGKAGVDGSFGNDTLSAVKKFQKDKGLSVDGHVGKATHKELIK